MLNTVSACTVLLFKVRNTDDMSDATLDDASGAIDTMASAYPAIQGTK